MAYTRINWQDGESGGTPLSAENLNKMDMQIEQNTNAIEQNTSDIDDLVQAEVYSISEVKTNKVWIDGKPIYRKVINTGACSLSTTLTSFRINIPNIESVIDINFMYELNGLYYKVWNLKELQVDINDNTLNVSTTASANFTNSKAIIEYTKTTD